MEEYIEKKRRRGDIGYVREGKNYENIYGRNGVKRKRNRNWMAGKGG